MATLTLTGDHRVLDGATAAQWLNTLQKVLEHRPAGRLGPYEHPSPLKGPGPIALVLLAGYR